MRICNFVIVAFALFTLLSCSDNRIFDETHQIPESSWLNDNTETFRYTVQDTALSYNLLLHIRNKTNYAYSNLWLFINTTAPNGETLIDTVEYTLANETGKWLGSGLGSVNSMLVPYKLNTKFYYTGIYTMEIKHAMRSEKALDGIMDIGVRVETINN